MPTKFTIKRTFDPTTSKVDYANELNSEQLKVVQHGEGFVLVLAGAGSGKTRTIVYRVAYLLEKGVAPENILLVTFTNKAAKEMLFRIERLLGQYPAGLRGGTFHHVANVLLRMHAKALGFQPNFTILDDEDSRDLITVIVKSLNIDPKKERFPSNAVLQDIISLARNTETRLTELIEERRPQFTKLIGTIEAIAREYAVRKRANNQMDFDDLLALLLGLLRNHPEVRARLAGQFHYILVDEYQDTNRLQAEIVELLAAERRNLLVVGDDAQSIYSFRGADIGNILEFPKRFPRTRVFKLETNYRSTQPILDVANAVIEHNRKQYQKRLIHIREGKQPPSLVPAASPKQEAEFVAQMMLQLRDEGIPLRSMAVLFRASHQSQALEFELTRRDIPYEYRGGVRFFERAHIKDVIAHLKILANPTDEVAWLRILNLQVGIGSQTAGTIYDQVKAASNLPHILASLEPDLPPRAQHGWRTLQRSFRSLLKEDFAGQPSRLIELLAAGEYRDYLMNEYPNAEDRLEDLEQLALFAERYDVLDTFLAEVSLQEAFGNVEAGAAEKDDEAVILSTIHQAKGLEWDVVFLIHLVEPGFPNTKALTEENGLEEERRLFYVAVTRAMTHLYLCYPLAADYRPGYGLMSTRLYESSRFLGEIDEDKMEKYELDEEMTSYDPFSVDGEAVIQRGQDG